MAAGIFYVGRPPADSSVAEAHVEANAPSSSSSELAPTHVEPDTIAVLPLYNIDGSDEMRIFADGLE